MFKKFIGLQRQKAIAALIPLGLVNCAPPLINLSTTVKQHMQEVTIPASNTVFAVASESPKDNAEWENVKAHALALVDSGEWLLASSPNVDPLPWQEAAKNMLDAAKAAAKAAEAKEADRVADAGNRLYEACESCHALYLNKPASKSD